MKLHHPHNFLLWCLPTLSPQRIVKLLWGRIHPDGVGVGTRDGGGGAGGGKRNALPWGRE